MMHPHHAAPAVLGDQPRHYGRLGLARDQIAVWEDGMRTDGGKNTYEWWYFDAELDDGSKLVITFYTKPFTDVETGLRPAVTVELDRPDGSSLHKEYNGHPDEFSASREQCDVQIGGNFFRGDLETYIVHTNIDGLVQLGGSTRGIAASGLRLIATGYEPSIHFRRPVLAIDVRLTREEPSWRPATGFCIYGEHEEHYFAWLPSVPQGRVEVTLTMDGKRQTLTGAGYHDHNWGNISMLKLVDNWYWARAKVGDYTVIACYITNEKEYGYSTIPIFMLARDGKVLADDAANVRFERRDVYTDDLTGKPVGNVEVYDYQDEQQHYVITFHRKQDLLRHKFIDDVHGIEAMLARLMGFDGAYLRFSGDVTLERYEGESVAERQEGPAIWELMYFGHAPAT